MQQLLWTQSYWSLVPSTAVNVELPQRNYYFYFLCREAVNAPSPGFLSPNPKTSLAVILPSPLVFHFGFQFGLQLIHFQNCFFYSAFLILFQGRLELIQVFHFVSLSSLAVFNSFLFSLGTPLHCLLLNRKYSALFSHLVTGSYKIIFVNIYYQLSMCKALCQLLNTYCITQRQVF